MNSDRASQLILRRSWGFKNIVNNLQYRRYAFSNRNTHVPWSFRTLGMAAKITRNSCQDSNSHVTTLFYRMVTIRSLKNLRDNFLLEAGNSALVVGAGRWWRKLLRSWRRSARCGTCFLRHQSETTRGIMALFGVITHAAFFYYLFTIVW
jgi:hypothetical protein